jgi:hypothetical protein
MEHLVEWEFVEETEVLEESFPSFNYVHHKSHITWSEIEPRPPSCSLAKSDDVSEERTHSIFGVEVTPNKK